MRQSHGVGLDAEDDYVVLVILMQYVNKCQHQQHHQRLQQHHLQHLKHMMRIVHAHHAYFGHMIKSYFQPRRLSLFVDTVTTAVGVTNKETKLVPVERDHSRQKCMLG